MVGQVGLGDYVVMKSFGSSVVTPGESESPPSLTVLKSKPLTERITFLVLVVVIDDGIYHKVSDFVP